MQTISDDLAALLTSKLQAGVSGFRGRVEIGELAHPSFSGTELLAYGANWSYIQGSHGFLSGFEATGFNDSAWATGPAAFGSFASVYGLYVFATGWTADTDLLVRRHISVPIGTTVLHIVYGIDNNADVFVNGSLQQSVSHSNGASRTDQSLTITSPPTGDVVIAVRCADLGDITFFDMRVTADGDAVAAASYQMKSISIDQSLGMSAGQMAVELANEDLALGWAGSSVFPTNSRIRAYGWLGAATNEVRTFTGVVDLVGDSRDPLTTTLACRDMMAILIDQTATAIAPQGAAEVGAVRTEANGVYLNREISYIVNDILDRWGWPTADRAITPTSYVLAEFIIADGDSGTGAIIGEGKLTGLVGYDAWADELGVFHFAPSVSTSALTEASVPVYTFRTGVDIMSLSDEMTQYNTRTRVKVRGPMTTATLTDTWRELWRTNKIRYPVGIWYDPSDSGNIRVLDRGTRRVYTMRQADQVVLSSVYLGSVIPYPLGLSGDPADASVYWVLNCPWKYGGSTSGNSAKKVRKSDNVVTATYGLPNGRWTDLKVSGTGLWLTNWDTDRFYKRSKTTGAAVADYSHSVGGVTQTNPSGLMVDGTTLHLFWSNGGTTARFLICDESAPGTVTKVIATAGTTLVGGEMDTTTHTECWGGSDTLGLVEKFALVDASSTTAEVFEEVADSALEDELGTLAQTEPRVHDTHSGDAAHSWMIRRDTVTLDAVISLAQATETARRRLDKLAHRGRVLDFGILGNPALQKTDLVRVEDPKTGIGENFLVNTYRSGMSNTYTGVIAGIPVVAPGDVVADDGSAS